jgi:hypothetical protein
MNAFNEAREGLASAIHTLPARQRESNAALLLQIVEELGRSYVLELGVIQRVARVDAADPEAIRRLRQDMEDYSDRKLFDGDRTRCHNIDRVARELREAGEIAELDQLEASFIDPLRYADKVFLDDIEMLLEEALDAVRDLDETERLEDARARQERFREETRGRVTQIKKTLTDMNKVAGELIDLA